MTTIRMDLTKIDTVSMVQEQPLIKLRADAPIVENNNIVIIDVIKKGEQYYGITGYAINPKFDSFYFMVIGTDIPIVPYIATGEILIPLSKPIAVPDTSFKLIPLMKCTNITSM